MLTGTNGFPTRAGYAERYGYAYDNWPVGYAIHHFGDIGDSDAIQPVINYHTIDLGWAWVGYYAIIRKNGSIYKFNDPDRASYHIAGRNHDLVGVCFAGNQDLHPPTAAQIAAFRWFHATDLVPKFGLLPIDGHRIWAPTTTKSCPGSAWETWKERLLP